MALNITNRKADQLTRQFAQMEGVSISDAVTIAMEEAISRRRDSETPQETVARVLARHGIKPSAQSHQTLPRKVFHEMWGDTDLED